MKIPQGRGLRFCLAQTAIDRGKPAATSASSRTQAIAGIAGGLAVYNSVDAVKDVAATIKSGTGGLGIRAEASLGVSSSRANSSTSQTVIGSGITGGDVTIIANGAGSTGAIDVKGSSINAGRDLTLAANGAINLLAAQDTATATSSSKSSGLSLGISAGVGLTKGSIGFQAPTVTLAASTSRSASSGSDITNVETLLKAGHALTIVTPGALTLKGAVASGDAVRIGVGSLAIESLQDTSTFASKSSSAGVSVSVALTGQVSGSINGSRARSNESFTSVVEQSGIKAGAGGFDIKVAGNTDLKGAVIASTAESSPTAAAGLGQTNTRNRLSTGTLTASNLTNAESFKASSVSAGIGIGANLSTSAGGQINTDNNGTKLPGIHTGIGTISATPPVALSASGSQSGTTNSAIADGTITITSGDAASQALATSISRDTATANSGAITQTFDATKRAEIDQAFAVTQQLAAQTSTFFANRAADQATAQQRADAAKPELEAAKAELAGLTPGTADHSAAQARVDSLQKIVGEPARLDHLFGAGSPARILATAINGAAGGNAAGGVGSLAQAAAVNVLQSLAVTEVKKLADGISGDATTRETVRAALQAVVGCAGAAAGGSGGCASAATGAAASVVLNNLISTGTTTATDKDDKPLSLEDQEARTNLIATLVAALTTAVGGNASAATTAALIETQNNALVPGLTGLNFDDRCQINPGGADCNHYVAYADFRDAHVGTVRADGTTITDPAEAAALRAEYAAAERLLKGILNPGYELAEGSRGYTVDGVYIPPSGPPANLTEPTPAQVTFILAAQFNGGVAPSNLNDFIHFNGGAANLGLSGQSAATLGRAFNETKALLEGDGNRAYLITSFDEFSRYSRDPSLINSLPPAEARRISLALSYVSYRAAINGTRTAGAQASDQHFLDVVSQVSNGNIASRRGGIGLLNGGIDVVNGITFIPGLLTSNGLAISHIPNPSSTPAEAGQAIGGEVIGNVAAIFTPAVASRVFGLSRYGGLSAESAATLETANAGRTVEAATIAGTGKATVDTRAPLTPNNVSVTFENAGSRSSNPPVSPLGNLDNILPNAAGGVGSLAQSEDGLVFTANNGKPISDMTMTKILRDGGIVGSTVHGFRSAFTDWVAEQTDFPKEVADKALAHKLPNRVEAAYRRTDFFAKRRELMALWAAHLDSAPSASL